MSGNRTGTVLLEVVVALAILALAGASVLALVHESAAAMEAAAQEEQLIRDADAFLHMVALWTSGELDQRLGRRAQGPWTLEIRRPRPTVYDIVLYESASSRVLLSTSIYRRGPGDAHP